MSPDDPDEVETPARRAMAALERLVRRPPLNDDAVVVDYRVIDRFLHGLEIEAEQVQQACAYVHDRERLASGRVNQLDAENKMLRQALHDCTREMAALTTSTRALCDRLDDLDADELSVERRAVRIALSGERIEALQAFLDYSMQWSQVRKLLRQICRELNATPEFFKTAEKWMYERLANAPKDWWRDSKGNAAR